MTDFDGVVDQLDPPWALVQGCEVAGRMWPTSTVSIDFVDQLDPPWELVQGCEVVGRM